MDAWGKMCLHNARRLFEGFVVDKIVIGALIQIVPPASANALGASFAISLLPFEFICPIDAHQDFK